MRKYLLILMLAFSCKVNAQGFGPSAANWHTPVGGQYSITGQLLGYNVFDFSNCPLPNSQNWQMMDIDGDARPDLVVFSAFSAFVSDHVQFGAGSANPYWKVYFNIGSGIATNAVNWHTPVGGKYAYPMLKLGYNAGSFNEASIDSSENWTLIDMNGDAKPDLVVTSRYKSPVNYGVQFGLGSAPYWKVYLNTGSGFSTSAIQWPTPNGVFLDSWGVNCGLFYSNNYFAFQDSVQIWHLSDINGDAMPDLVFPSEYNLASSGVYQYGVGQSPHWKVYLNTGTGFSSAVTNWTTPVGGYYSAPGVNHGFMELFNYMTNMDSAQVWSTRDMNGDNKPDLVITSEYLFANNGLMQFGSPTAPYWKIFLNTDTGFASTPVIWSTPSGGNQFGYFDLRFNILQAPGTENWDVEDLNGDNKPDLVILADFQASSGFNQQFNAGTSPYWKVHLNNGNGFSGSPVNWSTPVGGEISVSGANIGYCVLKQSYAHINNSQNWNLKDMDGDHIPDLVVTSVYLNSYGDARQFFAGTIPYWKVYPNSGYTGLSDSPVLHPMRVYPNPFAENIFIDTKLSGDLFIYTITGEVVYQQTWTHTSSSVDLSTLPQGVYVMKLIGEREIETARIVK